MIPNISGSAEVDQIIKVLASTSMFIGGIVAAFLDNTIPGEDFHQNPFFMPRLGGAYCFRRVRSQRKSVDWGTMEPALGGAYECYAHISSFSP